MDTFSFDYCILSDMHGPELREFGGGAKCEIVPSFKKYRPEFTKTCHFKRKKSFFFYRRGHAPYPDPSPVDSTSRLLDLPVHLPQNFSHISTYVDRY